MCLVKKNINDVLTNLVRGRSYQKHRHKEDECDQYDGCVGEAKRDGSFIFHSNVFTGRKQNRKQSPGLNY